MICLKLSEEWIIQSCLFRRQRQETVAGRQKVRKRMTSSEDFSLTGPVYIGWICLIILGKISRELATTRFDVGDVRILGAGIYIFLLRGCNACLFEVIFKLICVKIWQVTSKPVSTLYNARGCLVTAQACVARMEAVTEHCQFLFPSLIMWVLDCDRSPKPSCCFPSWPFSPLVLFFKCYIATTLLYGSLFIYTFISLTFCKSSKAEKLSYLNLCMKLQGKLPDKVQVVVV